MKHVVKYALEMHAPTVVREYTVTQNDTIEFVITLSQGGEPIDMSGVTPSLAVKRRDGVTTALPGTVSGNTVTFALGSTETAKPGTVQAAVQLYGADGRVSSLPFTFQVKADLTAAGTIPSEKEATLIEVVLQDGPAILQRAETAAADAERVAVENKTNWLDAVATVAERDTAYPSPKHGDTVRVTGTATVYRFETGKGWVVTDQYQQSAVDALNQQLADKAEKTEVAKKADQETVSTALNLKRDKSTPISLNDAGADLLAAIEGGEGATFNIESIPRDYSVTPGKTTFFKLSKNLFNKSTTVPGHVSGDTGQVLDNASYVTSDFIPVKENATYTLSRAYRYAFYDANKNYLSGGNLLGATNANVTVPAGAVYIRFGINTGHISPDVYMFVEGSTMPQTYEAYGQDIIPRERQEKQVDLVRDNLGDVFSLGADLASGTDLNTVTREGFFTGDGSRIYTNLPADHPTNRAFSLQVIPLYRGGNRWFFQKLTDFTQPFRKYVRKLDKNGSGTTAWVEDTVPNTKNDLVDGENLNNVTREGNYLGVNTRTYLNLPAQMVGKSFFLDVAAYGYTSQNFIVQQIRDFFDEMIVYVRTVKNGTASSWKQLALTSDSKPLSGMIGVSFGDSITEFGNYPDVISQRTGAQFHNVGFGGCRMAHHTSQYYNPFSMTKLADAIVSGDFSAQQAQVDDSNNPFSNNFKANFERLKGINFTTVDYITIFYGTNDYAGTSLGTVPLGESGDYGDSTFKGAINYVVDKLMTAFPQLKIAFITPMWRENPTSLSGGESDTTPNTDGVYLIEYVDAVIERANAHHLPALDMYRTAGINKYNRDKFLTDRVHPNAYGYNHVGQKIGAFLTSTF